MPQPPNQVLTYSQGLALAKQAGFKDAAAIIAVATAAYESGGAGRGVLYTSPPDNVNTDGSRDRGLYQINDRAHPDVSDACAYDPICATKAAFAISSNGTNFKPWMAFTSGKWLGPLPDVVKEAKLLGLDTAHLGEGAGLPDWVTNGGGNPLTDAGNAAGGAIGGALDAAKGAIDGVTGKITSGISDAAGSALSAGLKALVPSNQTWLRVVLVVGGLLILWRAAEALGAPGPTVLVQQTKGAGGKASGGEAAAADAAMVA